MGIMPPVVHNPMDHTASTEYYTVGLKNRPTNNPTMDSASFNNSETIFSESRPV